MGRASLTLSIALGGVVGRGALEAACRELAVQLAGQLKQEGLAYLEVLLQAETERGTVSTRSRFSRHRVAANLELHLRQLLLRLDLSAPVERLTATVAGLVPAPAEQVGLFGAQHLREIRLRRLLAEANQKYLVARASSLEGDRREKMLAFYDPFRRGRSGVLEGRAQGEA